MINFYFKIRSKSISLKSLKSMTLKKLDKIKG